MAQLSLSPPKIGLPSLGLNSGLKPPSISLPSLGLSAGLKPPSMGMPSLSLGLKPPSMGLPSLGLSAGLKPPSIGLPSLSVGLKPPSMSLGLGATSPLLLPQHTSYDYFLISIFFLFFLMHKKFALFRKAAFMLISMVIIVIMFCAGFEKTGFICIGALSAFFFIKKQMITYMKANQVLRRATA